MKKQNWMDIYKTVILVTAIWTCNLFAWTNGEDIAFDCYMLNDAEVCLRVPNITLTWQEAFTYCNDQPPIAGGSDVISVLARVYNADTQLFLADFLGNYSVDVPVWISATTENPEELEGNDVSQWRWVYDCDTCGHNQRREQLRLNALLQQGCYADNDVTRDLANRKSATDAGPCQTECFSTYTYAGLQRTSNADPTPQCWCDDDFGRFGPITGCAGECGPDNTLNCGGTLKNFVYRNQGTFGVWGYLQPDNDDPTFPGNNQYCAAAKLPDVVGPLRYRYFDYNCATKFNFSCAYDTDDICNNPIDNGYYNITSYGACVYVSKTPLTWYNARQFCRDRGGDLITFDNYTEHEEVLSWARTLDGDMKELYIGVYKYPLLWRRVNQDAEMSYYNFNTDEPQMETGDCLLIDDGQRKWKTANCASPQYFICLEGPDDDPALTTTTEFATTITQSPTAEVTSSSTTPASPGSSTTTMTPSTTSLYVNTGPGGSTGDGKPGLSRTEKILIGVLTTVGVLLLIFLILFFVLRQKKREEPSKIVPSSVSKERVDARLKATKPESGPLWDINEGYHNMGSTVNLMYAIKKTLIPKWRSKAKKTPVAAEPMSEPEPEMLVHRSSEAETVLVPDLLEHAPNGTPPDGLYGYIPAPTGVYVSPHGSQAALRRSYGSIPDRDSPEYRQTPLPGQAEYLAEQMDQTEPDNLSQDGTTPASGPEPLQQDGGTPLDLSPEQRGGTPLDMSPGRESPQGSDVPLVRSPSHGSL